jgi:hypothetical protein
MAKLEALEHPHTCHSTPLRNHQNAPQTSLQTLDSLIFDARWLISRAALQCRVEADGQAQQLQNTSVQLGEATQLILHLVSDPDSQ